jgi:hypothetical protein
VKNWPAVELTGAISASKARVIYHEGTLKAFGKRGLIDTLASEPPKRRRGWLRTWQAQTERGVLNMRGKCMTCGGWLRVLTRPSEELWHGEEKERQAA